MTFKEAYHHEKRWIERVTIMEMYHLSNKIKNKDWRVVDTAVYFGVSKAMVSENLMLAQAIEMIKECNSRNQALMKLRRLHFGDNDARNNSTDSNSS